MSSRRPRQISCPVLPSAQALEALKPLSPITPTSAITPVEKPQRQGRLPAFPNSLHPGVGLREMTPPLSPAGVRPTSSGVVDEEMTDVSHFEQTTATQQMSSDRSNYTHAEFLFVPCFDLGRARKFYSQCLGWHFLGDINRPDLTEATMMRYGSSVFDSTAMDFFTSGPADNKIMGALIERRDPPTQIHAAIDHALKTTATSHLTVHDIEDIADKIEDSQGIVKTLRFGVRGCMMDIGEFIDPEGNLFGLISHHPEQRRQS